MVILAETFGDEIKAKLDVHPDLARFTIAYTDADTAEELVVDTSASAGKGELWIVHVDRIAEELGVTTGATVYTEVDEWNLVAIDGLTNPASQVEALRAIDQCLRGVLLPSATGRIEYTTGWRRITDRKADTVQAFALAFTTNYDNLLDEIGYVAATARLLEDGTTRLLEDGTTRVLEVA